VGFYPNLFVSNPKKQHNNSSNYVYCKFFLSFSFLFFSFSLLYPFFSLLPFLLPLGFLFPHINPPSCSFLRLRGRMDAPGTN
jgi:hypothetical protein